MKNLWADRKLRDLEAALISLEAGWYRFSSITVGLVEALEEGISIARLQQIYCLDWQAIEQILMTASAASWESRLHAWLQEGNDLKHQLEEMKQWVQHYRAQLHTSPNPQEVTNFWLGYQEGRQQPLAAVGQRGVFVKQSSSYGQGERLGCQYFRVKQQIEQRLRCCRENKDLLTAG